MYAQGISIVAWADTVDHGDAWWIYRISKTTTIDTTVRIDSILPPRIVPKPQPPVVTAGIVFGPYALPAGQPGPFTGCFENLNPSTVPQDIARFRRDRLRCVVTLTGGSHNLYKTGGKFDVGKYQAALNRYNTPAIRSALASAVADGLILGNSVMDEPQQEDKPGNEAKSWGPAGWLTKQKIDDLCTRQKAIIPTMPCGVVHDHRLFYPDSDYRVVDFVLSQYRITKGSVTAFRDGGLAFAKRSKVAIIFAFNLLHGGTPSTTCPKFGDDNEAGTLCPPTPKQVKDWGLVLGPAGCALIPWRYENELATDPDYEVVFKAVADSLRKFPGKPCRRTA